MVISTSSYKQTRTLTSVAQTLFEARATYCPLAPYVVMTDPARTPDVLETARHLPKHSVLIYRHFGAGDLETAKALRQICFAREAQFLIGKDWQMAAACGADGVHLPQVDIASARRRRAQFQDWLLLAAVHDAGAIAEAGTQPLDGVILSPVFKTAYRGGRSPLGMEKFSRLAAGSVHPVFALGGINENTATALRGQPIAGIAGVSGF